MSLPNVPVHVIARFMPQGMRGVSREWRNAVPPNTKGVEKKLQKVIQVILNANE